MWRFEGNLDWSEKKQHGYPSVGCRRNQYDTGDVHVHDNCRGRNGECWVTSGPGPGLLAYWTSRIKALDVNWAGHPTWTCIIGDERQLIAKSVSLGRWPSTSSKVSVTEPIFSLFCFHAITRLPWYCQSERIMRRTVAFRTSKNVSPQHAMPPSRSKLLADSQKL